MSCLAFLPKNNVFTVTSARNPQNGVMSAQDGQKLIHDRLSQNPSLEKQWVETLLQGFTDDPNRRCTDSKQYANQAAEWSWEHIKPESTHFDVLLSRPEKIDQTVKLILQVFQEKSKEQSSSNHLDITGVLSDALQKKLGNCVLARNFLKELPEKPTGMNLVQYYAFCMKTLNERTSNHPQKSQLHQLFHRELSRPVLRDLIVPWIEKKEGMLTFPYKGTVDKYANEYALFLYNEIAQTGSVAGISQNELDQIISLLLDQITHTAQTEHHFSLTPEHRMLIQGVIPDAIRQYEHLQFLNREISSSDSSLQKVMSKIRSGRFDSFLLSKGKEVARTLEEIWKMIGIHIPHHERERGFAGLWNAYYDRAAEQLCDPSRLKGARNMEDAYEKIIQRMALEQKEKQVYPALSSMQKIFYRSCEKIADKLGVSSFRAVRCKVFRNFLSQDIQEYCEKNFYRKDPLREMSRNDSYADPVRKENQFIEQLKERYSKEIPLSLFDGIPIEEESRWLKQICDYHIGCQSFEALKEYQDRDWIRYFVLSCGGNFIKGVALPFVPAREYPRFLSIVEKQIYDSLMDQGYGWMNIGKVRQDLYLELLSKVESYGFSKEQEETLSLTLRDWLEHPAKMVLMWDMKNSLLPQAIDQAKALRSTHGSFAKEFFTNAWNHSLQGYLGRWQLRFGNELIHAFLPEVQNLFIDSLKQCVGFPVQK